MELLGDVGHVETRFGPFGNMLLLTQDRCIVCAERTIGSEIISSHPMKLLGNLVHMESRFGPSGDSVSVDAR
jgi:hypothetical protein